MYTIIGVKESTYIENSYETISPNSAKIAHDIKGKGITKKIEFKSYVIYVKRFSGSQRQTSDSFVGEDESDTYYVAIELKCEHISSYCKKLCKIGSMHLFSSNYEDAMANSTHIPIVDPLYIDGLEIDIDCLIDDDYYSEQFDVFVNLSSDPNTSVFKFSCAGQDERNPCGYAHVNMDLFQPKECK